MLFIKKIVFIIITLFTIIFFLTGCSQERLIEQLERGRDWLDENEESILEWGEETLRNKIEQANPNSYYCFQHEYNNIESVLIAIGIENNHLIIAPNRTKIEENINNEIISALTLEGENYVISSRTFERDSFGYNGVRAFTSNLQEQIENGVSGIYMRNFINFNAFIIPEHNYAIAHIGEGIVIEINGNLSFEEIENLFNSIRRYT